jgi:hypothetical protein
MSNFRLLEWIPRYLRWYMFAFGPKIQRIPPVPAAVPGEAR